MSMDLAVVCHHCDAKVGVICADNCSANGKKIIVLKRALYGLDLTIKNIILNLNKKRKEGR